MSNLKNLIQGFIIALVFSLSAFLPGCGNDPNENVGMGTDRGTLKVRITDKPCRFDIIEKTEVTISKVAVHVSSSPTVDSGFITIYEGTGMTFNLLDLQGGVTATLVNAELPAGTYNQIRLFISSATVKLKDGREFDLKIPRELKSGIKIFPKPPIIVQGGLSTDLILDFDVSQSFHPIPHSPRRARDVSDFHFKPVIRAVNASSVGSISGNVYSDEGTSEDTTDDQPLEDVTLTVFEGTSAVATTSSLSDGRYVLMGLPAGTYDITATRDGYEDTTVNGINVVAGNDTGRVNVILPAGDSEGDGGGISGDPNLTSLTLSAGALVSPFDPDTTDYTVDAGFLVSSTTVMAEPAETGAAVTVNGLPLAGGGISLAEGVNTLTVLVTAPGGASKTYTITVTRGSAAGFAQQAYLKASNAGAGDSFGWSVALSGDTLAVGAHREAGNATGVDGDQTNNSATNAGAVYVFVRDGSTWSQQAYLKASNAGAGDEFGLSVALSGDTLAVGARAEDSNATGVDGDQTNNSAVNAGAVYLFVRSGTTWSQQAYLKASNTDASDNFGWSVALSGDTLAVGAHLEDSNATGVDGDQTNNSTSAAGAVYLFVRSGTTWGQQAYLKASNTETNDFFGASVALSGDTLAVGAYQEDSNAAGVDGDQTNNSASAAGAVYLFVRSGTTWGQQAYLKASNTEAGDEFGWRVALSGDTLAVGARSEDSNATGVDGDQTNNNATNAGAVYLFVRDGFTWGQQAYLKSSNTDANDVFGWSVALSGDTLAVGASLEDSNVTGVDGNQTNNSAVNAGAVYLFVRSGTAWSQQAYLKASNTEAGDEFGNSVALSGDTLAIGAYQEDSNTAGVNGDQTNNSASAAGAVYMLR